MSLDGFAFLASLSTQLMRPLAAAAARIGSAGRVLSGTAAHELAAVGAPARAHLPARQQVGKRSDSFVI